MPKTRRGRGLMRPVLTAAVLSVATMFAAVVPAAAQIAMSGTFVAEASCPALQSIRQQTNPGAVATESGARYRLLGRNADPASHYLIEMPGAEPPRRWVAIGCGRVAGDADVASAGAARRAGTEGAWSRTAPGRARDQAAPGLPVPSEAWAGGSERSGTATATGSGARSRGLPEAPSQGRDQPRGGGQALLLAASWHAAFCETTPRARDCRSGGRADGFSLHGLWPQPRSNEFCGVPARLVAADRSGPWRQLPEPELSARVRRDLDRVMPGTVAELHRHEWLRHGTCYGGDANRYFADAVALIDALNASPVRDLFRRAVGQRLEARAVQSAFDRAFGTGAGERVRLACERDGGRMIITELQIGLVGPAKADAGRADLAAMLRAARPERGGCRGGIVDPAGFQ
ncbi:ribonuclease T2 family protein [Mangrovicella endophytica]|uniref:ribonuclease T2 family protein n=1 Tax=Mangrovicella endophytica TaxID=2066697 RepID=UPI00130007CD|nr:ribonuclease [Mangrovicella endophytica]